MKLQIAAIVIALAGCASLQNTPAQDRTYAAYERCHPQFPKFFLNRVYADGSFETNLVSGSVDMGAFMACMTGRPTFNLN